MKTAKNITIDDGIMKEAVKWCEKRGVNFSEMTEHFWRIALNLGSKDDVADSMRRIYFVTH